MAEAEDFSVFWDEIVEEKQRNLKSALSQARALYKHANRPVIVNAQEQVRTRMLNDARGMLRYASELAPDNHEVIELIAFVEESRGHIDKALAAYERLFDNRNKQPISSRACTNYGILVARQHETKRAITILRLCSQQRQVTGGSSYRNYALVNLANLYARIGRVSEAIDLLERQANEHGLIAEITLAVLYDKDERLSDAYEYIDRLQNQYRARLLSIAYQDLHKMPMVPERDRHYFTAFLLECQGFLPEARAAWRQYIRSGTEAGFSARAQRHIDLIDELLAARAKRVIPREP